MKVLIFIWTFLCLAFALEDETSGIFLKGYEHDLKTVLKELAENKDRPSEYGTGEVTAIVNEFVDRLLQNIDKLAKEKGVDPMPLQGFDDNFLVARVTLSNGSLSGISTISRNGDVVASYQSSTNILDLDIPIKFDHIEFKYKFYVFLLLVGHSGGLVGNIDSVKVRVELTFDFNVYQARLKKFSMVDTGHVSIRVDGGVIEAVLTVLSELVTTVIHPLIIGVIQEAVKTVLNIVIDIINTIINDLLHPNTTALLF